MIYKKLAFTCIFLYLLVLSCNKHNDFVKYTIKEGKHISTPIKLELTKSNVLKGSFYFTKYSKYNLHSVDQLDWNKLTGFKYDLGYPDRSVMIGWRYDTLNNVFQVAPYFNNNGNINPLDSEIINISENEIVLFQITHKDNTAGVYLSGKNSYSYKEICLESGNLKSIVNPYFGGNRKATNEISLYLKLE